MTISLQTSGRKFAFAIICVAGCAGFLARSGRTYLAERSGARLTPEALHRATQQEPLNAEYHYRLGMYCLRVSADISCARGELYRAVELNPYSSRNWLDLAALSSFSGNSIEQERALQYAMRVDPTTPDVAWEAANYYLASGNFIAALQAFRTVLSGDPDRRLDALRQAWRVTRDEKLIIAEMLPPIQGVYLEFLQILMDDNKMAAVETVWEQTNKLGEPLQIQSALPYIQFLIDHGQTSEAYRTWQTLVTPSSDLAGNLIFNAGFETAILNGGFDWRYHAAPEVKITIDTTEFHTGARSLEITYGGAGGADTGIEQFVPVEGDTSYNFSAFMKTEQLLSSSGPRIAVYDAVTGQRLLRTNDLIGTNGWQKMTGEFHTPPGTTLVRIAVVREPASPPIEGQLWLDDLFLAQM